MFVTCPYCHKRVLRWFYPGHKRKHTKLRPDGQMTDHVTLAPQDRAEGSLDGVPQVYRHPRCGVETVMPEDIIRSYLVNPLLHSDSSFCCGCSCYVYSADLVWTETGERMIDYFAGLRIQYLRDQLRVPLPPGGGLVVTPAVRNGLQAAVKRFGVPPPYYLALAAVRDGQELRHTADLAGGYDPDTEVVQEAGGVSVVLKKDQVEHFQGIVVDFAPGQNGFAVARYRPGSA